MKFAYPRPIFVEWNQESSEWNVTNVTNVCFCNDTDSGWLMLKVKVTIHKTIHENDNGGCNW